MALSIVMSSLFNTFACLSELMSFLLVINPKLKKRQIWGLPLAACIAPSIASVKKPISLGAKTPSESNPLLGIWKVAKGSSHSTHCWLLCFKVFLQPRLKECRVNPHKPENGIRVKVNHTRGKTELSF